MTKEKQHKGKNRTKKASVMSAKAKRQLKREKKQNRKAHSKQKKSKRVS